MAEMTPTGHAGDKKEKGIRRGKKLSTRVDLTPMVDLGFLLITFFIFTTTMSESKAMRLIMPADTLDRTPYKQSSTLTFLLARHNTVFYYEGMLSDNGSNLQSGSFADMRAAIIRKQHQLHDPNDLMVIIKPEKESLFSNTVDALDEMTINGVKRYTLDDISPWESSLVTTAN